MAVSDEPPFCLIPTPTSPANVLKCNEAAREFASAFAESETVQSDLDETWRGPRFDDTIQHYGEALTTGDVYSCGAEFCEMIDDMEPELPMPDGGLFTGDWPRRGVVWLGRPRVLGDDGYDAVAFAITFTHSVTPTQGPMLEVGSITGSVLSDGQLALWFLEKEYGVAFESSSHSAISRYNSGFEKPSGWAARWLAVFFALANTRVAQESLGAPRQAMKQYVRKHGSSPRIRTVMLRRSASESAGCQIGERSSYQHRWVVSGHWRWQPYGKKRALRKLIWVMPHVKGPDGAEFLSDERVFRLVR